MAVDIFDIQKRLMVKSDLDWFDCFCDTLKKENGLTVAQLTRIIGNEDCEIKRENRGSKFLTPFDERFNHAAINPDIDSTAKDAPIEFFAIGGIGFKIIIGDVKKRFNLFSVESNLYDGGTQLFFYPIPGAYAFTAVSFYVEKENREIEEVDSLTVDSVSFHFQVNLIKLRDGYSMIN
jgi:hypothetical protein